MIKSIGNEMKRQLDLKEYEKKLAEKVERGEVKCHRCGNQKDFLVNELGHVFCKNCHEKIRFFRWQEEI